MIYERFTAYGLKYSQPVAVWLILVCLVLFLVLRILSLDRKAAIMIRIDELCVTSAGLFPGSGEPV